MQDAERPGFGSLLAAFLVVYTTMGKGKFSQYQGWFGLIVFIIGGFMVYEMTPKGQSSKKRAKDAAKAFEATIKQKGDITGQGVKTTHFSLAKTEISFFGQTFTFSPVWAFVGGFFISAISSFIVRISLHIVTGFAHADQAGSSDPQTTGY